ncbi:hypothetical protein KFE80_12780 [bacterium SCSIO 12696]|nr:hypothetical protein KFE80_12780 [bacterium SCSIO 12696]
MTKPEIAKRTGIALAVAAAGALTAGATFAGSSSATTDLAHCYNTNVCKGHNDCKTAENACAGHGSCKGHGFVAMPTKACEDVGGTVKDAWRGEIAKADLVHCYGVNVCKGHNDCKTAENACAGHASCKGHGFVATTAKSCADIGGKVGP